METLGVDDMIQLSMHACHSLPPAVCFSLDPHAQAAPPTTLTPPPSPCLCSWLKNNELSGPLPDVSGLTAKLGYLWVLAARLLHAGSWRQSTLGRCSSRG